MGTREDTTSKDDDRAVSIAITHGLTIGITAVLLSLLLIGAGDLLSNQEQQVAEEQFDEIGADIVAQIDTLDSLNETGAEAHATAEPDYPDRVAGSRWHVELSDDIIVEGAEYEYALNITTGAIDRTLQYPVQNETAIETDSRVGGAQIELCLDDDKIRLGGC